MAKQKKGKPNRFLKWTHRVVYTLCLLVIVFVLAIFLANWFVVYSTSKHTYSNIENVPANDVGLVLGTSKNLVSGGANIYFHARMKAAAALYHTGKVKHLIVSGDNRYQNYNEPRDMYRQLLELGVPVAAITMDYAGFRTLDSVVRSQKVFQQSSITIVSQKFHNHRALLIARHHGIEASAYNAPMPDNLVSPRVGYREVLARCKALLDIYFLGKQPHFLGETIDIEV